MGDPYVYSGTDILINKFNIRDSENLKEAEFIAYARKQSLPFPAGKFDYSHLKEIHKHIFSDVYDWAGKERTVNIAKGNSFFCHSLFIEREIEKVFSKLKTDKYLHGLEHGDFCKKLSYYFNEINAVHPFREGNGRTLRYFCQELSRNAGYEIQFSKINITQSLAEKEYMDANIAGFNGEYQEMEKIFRKIAFPVGREKNNLDAERAHSLETLMKNCRELYGQNIKIVNPTSQELSQSKFIGSVIAVTDNHVVQRVGANKFICHDKGKLVGILQKDKTVQIHYQQNGCGYVSSLDRKKSNERDLNISR
jgi:cell filamentation protein